VALCRLYVSFSNVDKIMLQNSVKIIEKTNFSSVTATGDASSLQIPTLASHP